MSSLQSGIDDQKPSLFGKFRFNKLHLSHLIWQWLELLSEQQLAALIPPSLRYLLAIATHRNPRYLLRVLNSFDEIYALLMLAMEGHYLHSYGGGFTENFYGLKRERVLRIKGGEAPRVRIGAPALMRDTLKLRTRDIWNNLTIMVGLPYLKRKLDESYDIHVPQASILNPRFQNRSSLPPDATICERIIYYYKWFLRNIYPSINAAYYFSLLAFNLSYLFDNTKYSSPFLWLIGTRIRRLSQSDHRAIAIAAQSPVAVTPQSGGRPGQSNSLLNPLTLSTIVYPRLLSSLKILLPTSIFALKFLEWWHASDFARQLSRKAAQGLELPPPLISGSTSRKPRSPSSSSKLTEISPQIPEIAFANTVSLSSPAHQSSAKASPTTVPQKRQVPFSSTSHRPILTVSPPSPATTSLCPICMHPIQTPASVQTGYVFCYKCIFKWVDGSHERQMAFMDGEGGEEGWGDVEEDTRDGGAEDDSNQAVGQVEISRHGRWESGKGRCAVTGKRVLGGTDGLRRVMI